MDSVMQNGVNPLTPEGIGGGSSFWTTGQRIFGGLKADGGLETFDTTFFHWSHASDGDRGFINIATTNRDQVNAVFPTIISPDSVLQIPLPVPKEKLTLLRIEVDPNDPDIRAAYRKAEERMVGLMENVIDGDYKFGEVIQLNAADSALVV